MKFKLPIFLLALAMATCANINAQDQTYTAILNGPNEVPPNASPGTGFAQITINLTTHILTVHADFMNLTAAATAAHVHAPTATPFSGTAGVATQTPTFTGFPAATGGTYDHMFSTLDAATWNPAYITANGGTPAGAEAAFSASLAQGRAYFNIHTNNFPGGEIRGFLVPEPATIALVGMGGIALLMAARRARRS